MKKMISFVFALLVVTSVAMAGSFVTQQVVDTNSTESTSVVIDLSLADINAPFYAVDEVSFKNNSTGTLSVVFATVNMEGATTLSTLEIAADAIGRAYPRREELAQVFTSYVESNGVLVAYNSYVTNLVPYNVRNARFTYTLPPQGRAVTNWYQIKAR